MSKEQIVKEQRTQKGANVTPDASRKLQESSVTPDTSRNPLTRGLTLIRALVLSLLRIIALMALTPARAIAGIIAHCKLSTIKKPIAFMLSLLLIVTLVPSLATADESGMMQSALPTVSDLSAARTSVATGSFTFTYNDPASATVGADGITNPDGTTNPTGAATDAGDNTTPTGDPADDGTTNNNTTITTSAPGRYYYVVLPADDTTLGEDSTALDIKNYIDGAPEGSPAATTGSGVA
ncbi:MAG: hypothetical protein LBQ21_04985, partial [Clostridiales Family XIII bacterium]|nr:hypothetical protein [Clostridiales Family XIII bacterium]